MPDETDDDDFDVVQTPRTPAFVSQMNQKLRTGPITFRYSDFVQYRDNKKRLVLEMGDGENGRDVIPLIATDPECPLFDRRGVVSPQISLETFDKHKSNPILAALKTSIIKVNLWSYKVDKNDNMIHARNAEHYQNLKKLVAVGGSHEAVMGHHIRMFDTEFHGSFTKTIREISSDIGILYNFATHNRNFLKHFYDNHTATIISAIQRNYEVLQSTAALLIVTLGAINQKARQIEGVIASAELADSDAYQSIDENYLCGVIVATAQPPFAFLKRVEKKFPVGKLIVSAATPIRDYRQGNPAGGASDIVSITDYVDDLGVLIDLDIRYSQVKALMERLDNRTYSMAEIMAKCGSDIHKLKDGLLKTLRERLGD